MNLYTVFKLFNLVDFQATGLVARELDVVLEGIGEKKILITNSNYVSILYDGVFLPINLNNKNPFEFGSRAVFLDPNNDVWLGLLNAT